MRHCGLLDDMQAYMHMPMHMPKQRKASERKSLCDSSSGQIKPKERASERSGAKFHAQLRLSIY